MASEVSIPFSRSICRVAVIDPPIPLPPASLRAPSPSSDPGRPGQPDSPNPQARLEQEKREREDREAIQRTLAALTETMRRIEGQYRQQLGDMQRVAVE